MAELTASRTLVKSPPELWAACSDAGVLGRHLEPFGEIRITRLEPETTVAWEGERASGTVRIEPSGWGTRVTLTADTPQPAPRAAVPPPPEPSPPAAAEPSPPAAPPPLNLARASRRRRGGLWAWLFGREQPGAAAPSAEPVAPAAGPSLEPTPEATLAPAELPAEASAEAEIAETDGFDAEATLAAALASLGQAHHRPFSRG